MPGAPDARRRRSPETDPVRRRRWAARHKPSRPGKPARRRLPARTARPDESGARGPHPPYRTGATAVSARSRDFPKIRTAPPRPPLAPLAAAFLLLAGSAAPAGPPPADGSPPNPAAAGNPPAAANPAAADARVPLPPATRVLAAARKRLDLAESLTADLSQTVALGPATYSAAGTFAAARGGRVRLELTSETGPDLLQVCDGELLHTQYALPGGDGEPDAVSVTRRNVLAVREAAAATADPDLAGALALGGLSGVLATLETGMKWRKAVRQTVDGTAFLALDGRWTPDSRRALNRRYGGDVPEFLPDGAKVYLAADTLLPRRILYWRKDETLPAGRRTLMSLDFARVRLDAPLPAELFTYALPADADEDDVTGKAVARLAALGQDEDEQVDGGGAPE